MTEQLARGLQAYVQAFQRRESFFAEVIPLRVEGWVPAPRENSQIVCCNNNVYLVGGQNFECNNEIARLMTSSYKPHWECMEYSTTDPIYGRHRHTACVYSNKIIIFGGCFMYSMQRESRETTNQLLVYDTMYNTYNIVQ